VGAVVGVVLFFLSPQAVNARTIAITVTKTNNFFIFVLLQLEKN